MVQKWKHNYQVLRVQSLKSNLKYQTSVSQQLPTMSQKPYLSTPSRQFPKLLNSYSQYRKFSKQDKTKQMMCSLIFQFPTKPSLTFNLSNLKTTENCCSSKCSIESRDVWKILRVTQTIRSIRVLTSW